MTEANPRKLSTPELVAMVAGLMALNALAIDVMLPAMSEIGAALHIKNPNDAQQIVVVYMIGFGLSQLIIGPLTDRFGRRPVIMLTLAAYVIFSLGCTLSDTFKSLLIWRFLLGVTAGGTRVVSTSIVRDLYEGRAMARIMSFIMTVFMVVPILAPSIGQLVLFIAPWQGTFLVLALGGAAMLVWSFLRLPETRPPEERTPLNPGAVLSAYAQVFKSRIAFGYMLASGVIFGALFGFISASEQVFNDVFHADDSFVLWFALVAMAMSVANFTNASLVEKFGMRRLSHIAIFGFLASSIGLYFAIKIFGAHLAVFMPFFCLVFMCFGFVGPNFNALAMEPLGKIAGTASAVLGFASTTMAAAIGGSIARQFNGTLDPIILGYTGLGLTTLAILLVTEKGKLFSSR